MSAVVQSSDTCWGFNSHSVFLSMQMVQAFTHSSATVDGERGGKFRLLDGNVFGEFTDLVRLTSSL